MDLDASLWPAGRGDRLLRPEDYLPKDVEPPAMGWRGSVWRLGVRHVRPGPRELRHRSWGRLARRSMGSPKVIAVFSPKGGVGKSTTTLQLGQVLGVTRGDLVVALDADLADDTWVEHPEGTFAHEFLLTTCAQAGIHP